MTTASYFLPFRADQIARDAASPFDRIYSETPAGTGTALTSKIPNGFPPYTSMPRSKAEWRFTSTRNTRNASAGVFTHEAQPAAQGARERPEHDIRILRAFFDPRLVDSKPARRTGFPGKQPKKGVNSTLKAGLS